jgi:type I restriction enzyme, S subunit
MKEYTLRDLLQIKNGKDHKSLGEGKIPVLGSGGIMRYADKFIFDDESILLPRKGSLSNIQYVNSPFWTVDTLYYTIVNKTKVNAFYLYNLLRVFNLSNLNTGTGVPSMTFNSYYDLKVLLPELNEQYKIAGLLSILDDKIELNNKINAELEAMAKTLYDYWFVQFDFPYDFAQGKPDKNGKPYKSSGGKMVWNEVLKREVPEGWSIKNINEIIEVKDGTHDSPKPRSQGYRLITSKNLKVGGLDFEDANFISEEDYESVNKRSKVETGDILFSMIGNIGTIYKIEEEEINFAIKNVALYKTSQNLNLKNFIYMYLRSYDMKKHMQNVISGSIQKFIGLGSLREMSIFINPQCIEMFDKRTSSIFRKLNNLKLENQKLVELRDWLLPMLMNGQVKVK